MFRSLDLLLIYEDDGGFENSLTFTKRLYISYDYDVGHGDDHRDKH